MNKSTRVWLLITGMITLCLLRAAYMYWPRHITYLKSSPNAMQLNSVPPINPKLRWRHKASWSWPAMDQGNFWAYPQPDGGLAFVDDANAYFIDAKGAGSEPVDRSTRLFFCNSFIPDLQGGYFASHDDLVYHLASNGAFLSQTRLDHYISLLMAHPNELFALSSSYIWELSFEPQSLSSTRYIRRYAFSEAALRPDGIFLLANESNSYLGHIMQVIAVGSDGLEVWHATLNTGKADFQRFRKPHLTVLADNSTLVGSDSGSLSRITAEGRLIWTLKPGAGNYLGRNLAVLSDKTILVWMGEQLHRIDMSGNEQGLPIQLRNLGPMWPDSQQAMFHGMDGNVYLQVAVTSEDYLINRSNTILALNPDGQTLWRMELGTDNFQLIAAGYHGEIYGLRKGEATDWHIDSGTRLCDIECLLPDQAALTAK